ncbi:conserved hypothetical protein (plasmid) [Borreliella afzelii PKo]|uniref:Uncharacterized protein n=2 Tax=Borreliella TaxID=64895 RepID=G0ITX8_BORAP|nr:conserved hypothetical protein [Borreliella afzelii PKo]MBB6031960.1 hypothetical protein [Borreliella spielmanii]
MIAKVIFNKKHNIAESIASFLLYFSVIKFKENSVDKKIIPDIFKYISNAFNLFSITIDDIIESNTLKQKRPNFPKNR